MSEYKFGQLKSYHQVLLITAVVMVAFNLRPAITSVGPVIGLLRDNLSLSNWSIGILTSLPLFAFAIMSPLVPRLSFKLTNEIALIVGMCLLAVGLIVRSIPFVSLLFIGTIIIGIGIAVSNVLLPGIIKERFPSQVGMMTSVYTTAMSLFAALASGVSVPIAIGAGLGWEVALGVWIVPALAAIGIWVYFVKKRTSEDNVRMEFIPADEGRMWKSPLAWQVAIFLGLQAFSYNALMTWLPQILIDYGVSGETAGWMLSFNQFIGLPASLLIPIVAGKMKAQRGVSLFLCILAVVGYIILLVSTSYQLMITSVILLGVGFGGLFPLSLAFIGMRANSAMQAAKLSGMAQAIGYGLAAIGPILLGSLVDATGTWTYSLLALLVVTILTAVVGFGAGRNRVVSEDFIEKEYF